MTDIPTLKPLPVHGYTPQSTERVELVNQNKILEEQVLQQIDFILALRGIDSRWANIARTHIQEGFMALNRAVFRPERLGAQPRETLDEMFAGDQLSKQP